MSDLCPNTIVSIFISAAGIHFSLILPSRINHLFPPEICLLCFCARRPPSPDDRQWGGPLAAKPPDGPLCHRNHHPVPPLGPPCCSSLPFPSYSQSFSGLIFCFRFYPLFQLQSICTPSCFKSSPTVPRATACEAPRSQDLFGAFNADPFASTGPNQALSWLIMCDPK